MTTKCKDRVKTRWQGRRADLEKLFEDYYNGTEKYVDELGTLNEYGLCIDLVEAGTFDGQREDYIRYQFSYGGPSDELRIYKNGEIEYWFLDWFDGACVDVGGDSVAEKSANFCKELVPWD